MRQDECPSMVQPITAEFLEDNQLQQNFRRITNYSRIWGITNYVKIWRITNYGRGGGGVGWGWGDNQLWQIWVSNQLQQHSEINQLRQNLEINQLRQNLEEGCQNVRLGVWLMQPGKGFILGSVSPPPHPPTALWCQKFSYDPEQRRCFKPRAPFLLRGLINQYSLNRWLPILNKPYVFLWTLNTMFTYLQLARRLNGLWITVQEKIPTCLPW